jgi:hypothetical protein
LKNKEKKKKNFENGRRGAEKSKFTACISVKRRINQAARA